MEDQIAILDTGRFAAQVAQQPAAHEPEVRDDDVSAENGDSEDVPEQADQVDHHKTAETSETADENQTQPVDYTETEVPSSL